MCTRIAGYDFALSLALFGLVIAHFSHSVDHSDFYLLRDLIQEGATIAFLILGGVGISLLDKRNKRTNEAHRSADSRKRLIRRAAFLLVIGICCYSIWQDNFLCFFSICIAIGAMLLTASNRWLWLIALLSLAIFFGFIFLVLDYSEMFRSWEAWLDSAPWTVEGMLSRLHLNGFHFIFPLTAFLLIGMWLGRREVPSPNVRKTLFFGGITVTLVSSAPWLLMIYAPSLLRYVPLVPSRPSLSDISGSGVDPIVMLLALFQLFAEYGTAAAIIGGGLMLTERFPSAKGTKPFIATGQLALTLYVAHLIIGGVLLKAPGVLDKTLPYAIGSAVIFCLCAVVFSHYWSKRFEHGPLEWGMRRVTG